MRSMRMCERSRTFTIGASHHRVEREFSGMRKKAAVKSHRNRRAERAFERRTYVFQRADRPAVEREHLIAAAQTCVVRGRSGQHAADFHKSRALYEPGAAAIER